METIILLFGALAISIMFGLSMMIDGKHTTNAARVVSFIGGFTIFMPSIGFMFLAILSNGDFGAWSYTLVVVSSFVIVWLLVMHAWITIITADKVEKKFSV